MIRAPVFLALLLPGASGLTAQDTSGVLMPRSVHGFALTETRELGGTAGTVYRYQAPQQSRVDVYVYAVPPERLASSDSSRLATEVGAYLAALRVARERGIFDDYEVAINERVPVETSNGVVWGGVVIIVNRRGQQEFVSYMHLFVRNNSYVKVRLTFPADQMKTSTAPNFALELAKLLFP